jgi:hypothetical protein
MIDVIETGGAETIGAAEQVPGDVRITLQRFKQSQRQL